MPSLISEDRKTSYRPEIDGLRAISVLAVVLYHFQLGLPGGFVGVDVFFVISGYLITSIIIREIENGSFSIRDFWARRIRRILPAAGVVGASVIMAGICILEPESIINLAKSSVAQVFILSNVFFWRDTGYFSTAAEFKPLLHTWSLSIEEQFYLCLPFCLLFLVRFLRHWVILILVLALFLSFGLSIYGVYCSPQAAFFLLPTRAWELLAGSVTAAGFRNPRLSVCAANLLSASGLSLVILPMFLYSDETKFPGLNATPPVIGAAIFILANSRSNSIAGRLLSLRPLVFVGLISYSLYLWHWPIFSFSRHMLIETDGKATVILLVLALVLSFLSWKFVETPFRNTHRLGNNVSAFKFAALVSAILMLASVWIIVGKGFPGRFDARLTQIIEDVQWTGSEYKVDIGDPLDSVRFGAESKALPDFVLWGDSHAMLLGQAVNEASADLGLSGVGFITPSCPPVPGLWMPENPHRSMSNVLELNQNRLDWIIDKEVKNVIICARWDAMYQEVASGARGFMVTDSNSTRLDQSSSILAFERQLKNMVTELVQHGVTVWILPQVPEVDAIDHARKFMIANRFPRINGRLSGQSPSHEDYQAHRSESMRIFQSLESQSVHIVDPAESFYVNGLPFALYDTRAYYRDSNHLTRHGVDRFLKPLIAEVLGKVLDSRNEEPR